MNKYIPLVGIAIFFVTLISLSEISDINPADTTEQKGPSTTTPASGPNHKASAVDPQGTETTRVV